MSCNMLNLTVSNVCRGGLSPAVSAADAQSGRYGQWNGSAGCCAISVAVVITEKVAFSIPNHCKAIEVVHCTPIGATDGLTLYLFKYSSSYPP